MNTDFTKKTKKWPWILPIVFLVFFAGLFYAYSFIKNLTPAKLLQSDFVKGQIVKQIGEENSEIIDLLPALFGFDSPKTYLILFLNNTELRPGGGFIGSYATLQVNQGQTKILQMDGTENMRAASSEAMPPQIIKDKLLVDKWYFRDSNWSPDFVESSKKTLEMYKNGNNVSAREISGVIGVTTDVLEDLMKIAGPFVVDGVEFTSDNVIEKLEYEVEYGYGDRGIVFKQRKDIMKPFMLSLMNHVKDNLFKNLDVYKSLALGLLKEKNVVIYSLSPDIQAVLDKNVWSGRMQEPTGDYLMWVDANLAALKTDRVIRRSLSYSLLSVEKKYKAKATMTYSHTGKFDWRTTKYLSYVRIYVPVGAKLLSTQFDTKDIEITKVNQGIENNKQWFGAYISIEPGDTKNLSFIYELPSSITNAISAKSYNLLVQKQIGMNNLDLTTHLEFDNTSIVSAEPAEEKVNWGNSVYDYKSDVKEDKNFVISF